MTDPGATVRAREDRRPSRGVLLLFLDGVGIGPADAEVNPFLVSELPRLRMALGGAVPSLDELDISTSDARAFPLDACLGMAGTPQSGTGQIALFTGIDAPRLFGRHFGPWPPVRLRERLERENLLVRAVAEGARVAFANAYPEGYPAGSSSRRVAAPPLAARAAGLLTRHEKALAAGDAVASEILNDGWIRYLGHRKLPRITAEEAGANLAAIAGRHDLTLYAHYQTDTAGHRGDMAEAVAALERVDAFLTGVLEHLPEDVLTVVVSDHGNIEDVRTGHTRNPALGLAFGRGAGTLVPPGLLTDIPGWVLGTLGVG